MVVRSTCGWPMRLLVVTQYYPPPFVGGSLVYVHNLLDGLTDHVDVLTGALPPGEAEVVNPRHTAIRTRFFTQSLEPTPLEWLEMYLYMPWWLLTSSVRRKYDAVLLSTGLARNALLTLLLAWMRVPVIPIAYAEELTVPLGGLGATNRLKRWLLRTAYPQATGVVAVCGFTRDVLLSAGVAPDRIAVIVPAISGVKTGQVRASARKPGHQILTVGRLIERKGFNFLIEAVARLRTELPDVRLVVVGDGAERESLRRLAASLTLQSHVRFAGLVSDEELRALYETSNVFVLASVVLKNGDCEGTPTVLIEASSLGLPVIGGTGGGTDAAVEDGRNGFLVDCSNVDLLAGRLRQLLTNPELAGRMGAAGIEKVATEHLPAAAGARLREFVVRLLAPSRIEGLLR